MKKFLVILLALIMLFSLTSCQNDKNKEHIEKKTSVEEKEIIDDGHYPVEVEVAGFDDEKVLEKFEQKPQRVLAGNLSSLEMLIALDCKDDIIGSVKRAAKYNGKYQEVNDIKGLYDKRKATYEVILKHTPDLFIARKQDMDWREMKVKDFNRDGVNVYTLKCSLWEDGITLKTVIEDIENLGAIMHKEDKAKELSQELEARLKALEEKSKQVKEERSIVIITNLKRNSFMMFTVNKGLHTDMISYAKLTPVPREGNEFSYENLVTLNPDVLIYVDYYGGTSRDSAKKTFAKETALQDVNAVKNGHIKYMHYDELLEFGLTSFDAAEEILDWILEIENN